MWLLLCLLPDGFPVVFWGKWPKWNGNKRGSPERWGWTLWSAAMWLKTLYFPTRGFSSGCEKGGKKTTEGCDLNPPHTEFIQLQTFFVVVWSFSLMNHRPGRRKWIVCECAYFWEPLEWEFGIKSLKWAIWCFSNSEMALWCPWCVDGILSKAPLINLWVNLKSMISAFEIFIIIFHRFLSKLLWLDWL